MGVDQELSLLCTQCFEVSYGVVEYIPFLLLIRHVYNLKINSLFFGPKNLSQNSVDKEYCGMSLECKMEAILKRNLLTSATETLVRLAGCAEHTISLDLLEGVARMRYCLLVVAQLLQRRVSEQGHTQSLYGRVVHQLLEETRYEGIGVCESSSPLPPEQGCMYREQGQHH